jgi:transcriptional regulator with XRE-family HTH domain
VTSKAGLETAHLPTVEGLYPDSAISVDQSQLESRHEAGNGLRPLRLRLGLGYIEHSSRRTSHTPLPTRNAVISCAWQACHESATICAKQMPYAHSEDASTIRVALGALLRRRREEAEHSLSEIAAAAELSPAYLSEVERGLKDISTDRLMAIARALEVSVAELYLQLARSLGSREAMGQRGSWPDDPRTQLRIATANLRPQALRSVAHFSLYLAATQATPQRRRIGFTVDR